MRRNTIFILFLIFTLVPLIELAILIRIGSYIGFWNTIGIIILTGICGAFLAKQQGFWVINAIKRDISNAVFPADKLFDGALILVGATLLITPGLLTDILGILCLIPVTREVFKLQIKNFIKKKIIINTPRYTK
ncbi:MAG: FxsA family protein [Candidatus Cloacimonetes bacterium]|nr:FxsA family protein [Candidatus Cloacimonadota bacterium]